MSDKTKEQTEWIYRIVVVTLLGFSSTIGFRMYDAFDQMNELIVRRGVVIDQLQKEQDAQGEKIDKLFDVVWRIRMQQQANGSAPIKEIDDL